jgi:hypothetical protein
MNAFIYSIKDTSKTPIIYLSNSQDVYEFCNKNNINLTSLINPDEDNSAIDNVTYYLENFDFAINIFDICSQKNFLKSIYLENNGVALIISPYILRYKSI